MREIGPKGDRDTAALPTRMRYARATGRTPPAPEPSGCGRRRRWRSLLARCRRAVRIAEILEELGIGRQHQPRIRGLQARLIGLHRAVEIEEFRVLAEGLGEDLVDLGFALAAQLLRFAVGIGDDDRCLPVGLGTDAPRRLLALGADLGGLPLTLGLHALIDRLAVGLGQIGTADLDVDHLDAETDRLMAHLFGDLGHQLRTVVAHQLDEAGIAKHPADGRIEDDREPRLGNLNGAHRLEELQRIDDLVATEGIDHQPLLIGGNDLQRR